MKKHLLLVAGCVLCGALAFGQAKLKFRSDNYLGFSAGELGSYGRVQTVNGVATGPWFLGLGTGLDYYRYRSVPIFLSLTRDIPVALKKGGRDIPVAPKRGGLFINLNGGIDQPWVHPGQLPYGIVSDKFYAGTWWNAGLGYRWKLSPKTDKALLVTAAYGVKKLSERQKGQDLCFGCVLYTPDMQTENPATYEYDYVNRVWLFSVGFQF